MNDGIKAFQLGYKSGQAGGFRSPREADSILRKAGLPVNNDTLQSFGCGNDDGARGDDWRLKQMGNGLT